MPRLLTNRLVFAAALALAFYLCRCNSSAAAETAGAEIRDQGDDAAEIAGWIAQLDDDQFAAREWAQRQLETSGHTALDAIAEATNGPSLEVSTRAVNILIRWAESEDPTLRINALERLVALESRPTDSALAGEALDDVRQEAAIDRLRAAGAQVFHERVRFAIEGRSQPLQIVIGPNWTGGEAGLANVADVHDATTISFHSAPIGESAVPLLLEFSQIKRVEFYGTKLSDGAMARLNTEMTQLQVPVDRRGGAQLGIEGTSDQPGRGGALVNVVHVNSAAARAGLRGRDVITELDGERIPDFKALTQKIATFEPGDSVDLSVLRQGKLVQLKVEFDRWGEAAHPNAREAPNVSRGQRARAAFPDILPPQGRRIRVVPPPRAR